MHETREVNPYKKVATFCKLFLSTVVDQGVHHFLFISDEHIVNQSKTSLLQNNIYKQSIYYILWFKKDIQYCRKKKCGHHEKSCELKQLLFLRVYLSEDVASLSPMKPLKSDQYFKGSLKNWNIHKRGNSIKNVYKCCIRQLTQEGTIFLLIFMPSLSANVILRVYE